MSEACVLIDEISSQNEWISNIYETHGVILLPNNPSAFAFGLKELCESRVNILCGILSQPCSG